MDIPVYITNRNRLTSTRRLVEWLLRSGTTHVTILDNASTYPPLLDWYAELSKDINIIKLSQNKGAWVFWELDLNKQQTSEYIVTDSDIVPSDNCPVDLIAQMEYWFKIYFGNVYWKLGPSIRTDNLPDSPWKEEVIEGQKRYHTTRINDVLFSSAIDSTFAMYKGGFGTPELGHAIRIDYPYTVEHIPWYVWPLDDEERYYIAHAEWWSGHSKYIKDRGLL